MGCPSPQYVKTVTVTAHDTDITVSATYENPSEGEDIVVTKELKLGESHFFDEKTVSMGTWDAVCIIKSLSGKAAEEAFNRELKEDCGGRIQRHIKYTVHTGGDVKVKELSD